MLALVRSDQFANVGKFSTRDHPRTSRPGELPKTCKSRIRPWLHRGEGGRGCRAAPQGVNLGKKEEKPGPSCC